MANNTTAAPVQEQDKKARTDDIVLILRKRIADHDLPPGARLQEVELANEFSISRSAVREILGALEQRGLITRVPNRGAIVARLEAKEIYEIFDVREALEGLCVRHATQKAPSEVWAPYIDQFGDAMEKAIENGDIATYSDALEDLRTATIAWADNSHAAHFLDLMLEKTHLLKLRVTLLPGRAAAGRRMHLEMLKYMHSGDAENAERMKKEIICSAREWLERYRSFIM